MRERLIEIVKQVPYGVSVGAKFTQQFSEKVTDHLLSNGVIVPPCKVGDKVYIIDEGDECTEHYVLDVMVTAIGYDISGFWITMSLPLGLKQSAHVGERSFGKSVFLTREEAERELKGGEG